MSDNRTRDSGHVRGHVSVLVEHEDGRTETIEQDNLLVNAGRNRIAAIIAGNSTDLPDYIAIGTGTTAAALTDTALGTEVDRNQIASKTDSVGVATFKAFFGKSEANGNTIAEVGLFDLASGGTMFCRAILSSTIAKTSTISLTITWTLTFSDGS